MSDDSITTDETPDVAEERSRAERAAELTSQAQALFGVGTVADGEPAAEEDDEAVEDAAEAEDIAPEDTAADDTGAAPAEDSAASDPVAHDTQAAEDGADDDGAHGAAGDDDGADVVAQGDEVAEDEVTEPVAAAPSYSFGLVFQAPDLTDLPQRRSRRATAGVTTPTEVPEDELDRGGEGSDDASRPTVSRADTARGSTSRQDGDDSDDGDGDDGDDASQRNGRRRRRGGKGRRGRGQTDGDGGENAEADEDGDGDAPQSGSEGEETEGEQAPAGTSRRRSRGRTRGRGGAAGESPAEDRGSDDGDGGAPTEDDDEDGSGTRRRRRRRRSGESGAQERPARDEVTSVKGSTRLEAKRQRRREGREAGRRRTVISEAEFLARRESVDRVMVVRGLEDRTQIAVMEDGVPVEHYVSRSAQSTMVGNVYLGRVQNVLPSMEAAFVDIGKGRNAVLYAGEVNWDAAGLDGQPKRIENALKSGESVLVQVTKDPIGHKGARLTSQISLPGRFLVYVPGNSMTGISRKLPDTERTRLKKILKEVVPDEAGVIVRTAAEGASEAELRADVERLTTAWDSISSTAKARAANAPVLLHGEPDMTVRVIRDVFTEDFSKLVVSGEQAWTEVKRYIDDVAPDLADRVEKHTGTQDIFTVHRVHEAIAKAMDRKVWLPSGGSLVIDRTEAMTVVDVNTGKFTGSGGNLEETVTKNNIEAAEEIVRQLRLRDIGGIIVIDFIDMVLESNRDLVVRRLLECLGRDRTKHQVAEVTSLGLVQMTRKRVGSGLIEVFSETCAHCAGRGVVVQSEPVARTGNGDPGNGGNGGGGSDSGAGPKRGRGRGRGTTGQGSTGASTPSEPRNVLPTPNPNGPTPAQIAAAAHAAALNAGASSEAANAVARETSQEALAPDASPAEEHATEPAVEGTPPGEPTAETTVESPVVEPAAPKRSRSRARSAAAAAPAAATPAPEVVQPVTPETPAAPGPAMEPEAGPISGPEHPEEDEVLAEEKPRRRRRGRVSAPAGPPTGADAPATD
ncbi:Rne/Rng family ribonuclease [Ornithinimicrobium cerasi]|uniref:Ribonuclease E n=1 Tax=Ornithinimicrobium cerasi TaxID=2248773 RepID=A0A285VLU9_9MICO|nr:Rne/Rng family ribonuclease [Ornithinimicrobium cerasi]SOC55055.1 RNAse G [Ornithinimicrobium cerasi]